MDVHPDGALSTAEWARLIRVMLYFSLAYGEKSKSTKLGAAYAISVLAVPLAAAALVSSYDYDGDGKTSLDELFHAMAQQDAASIPGIEGLDPETRSKIEQAITILRGLSEQVPASSNPVGYSRRIGVPFSTSRVFEFLAHYAAEHGFELAAGKAVA